VYHRRTPAYLLELWRKKRKKSSKNAMFFMHIENKSHIFYKNVSKELDFGLSKVGGIA
jgi:hypothetical protein